MERLLLKPAAAIVRFSSSAPEPLKSLHLNLEFMASAMQHLRVESASVEAKIFWSSRTSSSTSRLSLRASSASNTGPCPSHLHDPLRWAITSQRKASDTIFPKTRELYNLCLQQGVLPPGLDEQAFEKKVKI
jgi:hypothetical protein